MSPNTLQTGVAVLTTTAALGLLAAGIALYRSGQAPRRELGIGLITGATISFVTLGLQLTVSAAQDLQAAEDRSRSAHLAAEQAAADRENAFRLSVALSPDLSGFSPQGHSLAGYYLSGKRLKFADLTGADLRRAQLQRSILRSAHLERADLSAAVMFDADLSGADVAGADLSGADLRYAVLAETDVWQASSLRGATVNRWTCWPTGFSTARVRALGVRSSTPTSTQPFGRYCAKRPDSTGS